MSLLECVVIFNVNICYLTKLKLASGNAYNCNDRSGVKGKDVFFYLVFKEFAGVKYVTDDEDLNENQVCVGMCASNVSPYFPCTFVCCFSFVFQMSVYDLICMNMVTMIVMCV